MRGGETGLRTGSVSLPALLALDVPDHPAPFSISVASQAEHVALRPVGDLDLGTAEELVARVGEFRRTGADRVVIDLTGVRFLDSAGLRALLALRNDAKRNGHRLALAPGPRQVQRVFELTATRTLFDWTR